MDVLFSIHPEYARSILSGSKTMELRKTDIRKWAPGDKALIYATSPVCRIVGSCTCGEHRRIASWALPFWPELLDRIEISEDKARSYIGDNMAAHLYELRDPIGFESSIPFSDPPQSFRYLTSDRIVSILNPER